MKKSYLPTILFLFVMSFSKAQVTTAMPFTGTDCNGNNVDIFADLDAGKAVVLHFFMPPTCTSCPPPAKKIQAMANRINTMYPGMVKGYAFPFQNSSSCTVASTWVNSNNLSAFYTPVDSGASQVAYYGWGMPTVVLLGGADHRVMFLTESFVTADTTTMRDSILALLASPSGISSLPETVSSFNIFPNPAVDVATINLDLKETSNVFVDISDMPGRQIEVIMNGKQSGVVRKELNTANLPNGLYLVRLLINGKAATQKLLVNH